MASDKELRTWVQDRMHGLVGFADSTTAAFIVSSAKKQPSSAALTTMLESTGFPAGAATQSFVCDLLARVAPAAKAPSAYAQQQKAAASMVRQNARYGLLDDEEEADVPVVVPSRDEPKKKDKERSAKSDKQLRTKSRSQQDDGDEETRLDYGSSRQKRKWEEDGQGGAEGEAVRKAARQEADRERDKREKEEFEARLRAKDESKTKKVGDDGGRLSKREQKEADRRK